MTKTSLNGASDIPTVTGEGDAGNRETESEEKPQERLLKVTSTPDRGLAVFAARKIKAGTLVLAETPLIYLDKNEENDSAVLEHRFSTLSRAEQKLYLCLFDAQKSRMSRIASIYYSNCYNCDGFKKDGRGGSAVGVLVSRINHNCVPNVQFCYDEACNEMRFHAIRDIPKGKEVCSNYDKAVFEVVGKRQRKQQMYYGFICRCEACEPKNEFWAKSDDRRKGMLEAFRTVQECEKQFFTEDVKQDEKQSAVVEASNALVRLEGLLIKECLVGVPLANTYRSLAKWSERQGNAEQTAKWKVKEREVCVVGFGIDAERTKEIDQKLKALRKC